VFHDDWGLQNFHEGKLLQREGHLADNAVGGLLLNLFLVVQHDRP
jgi:hypothetical protein